MHESVINRPSRMKRAESSFCYYALFTRTSKCTHVLVLNERRKDGGGSRHSSSLSRLIVRSFVPFFTFVINSTVEIRNHRLIGTRNLCISRVTVSAGIELGDTKTRSMYPKRTSKFSSLAYADRRMDCRRLVEPPVIFHVGPNYRFSFLG